MFGNVLVQSAESFVFKLLPSLANIIFEVNACGVAELKVFVKCCLIFALPLCGYYGNDNRYFLIFVQVSRCWSRSQNVASFAKYRGNQWFRPVHRDEAIGSQACSKADWIEVYDLDFLLLQTSREQYPSKIVRGRLYRQNTYWLAGKILK